MNKFSRNIMVEKDYPLYGVWKDYYHRKMLSVRYAKSVGIVAEIGVRGGYSAYMFCLDDRVKKFIGFDCYDTVHHLDITNEELHINAKRLIGDKGHIYVINTQSHCSLRSQCPDGVDFFHVDADHSYEGVMHDLGLALEVLNDNGTILLDDVGHLVDGKIEYGAALVRHAAEIFAADNDMSCGYLDTLTGEFLMCKR